MSNLIANIKIDDVDLNDKHFLELINKHNDNMKVNINIPVEDIDKLFYFYVKKHCESLSDIDEYSCIRPKIYKSNNDYYFTLDINEDEDNNSDIDFLLKELKSLFGINLRKDCKLKQLFSVLLMGCTEYSIIEWNTFLKINFDLYYESYKYSWIKDFMEGYTHDNLSCNVFEI